MALQASVATSKILVLVGAGLTGSIVLRSGRLAELIAQFQELLRGLDEVEVSHYKYDPLLLSAQIRQLAEEIKELSLSRPVAIIDGNPFGHWISCLAPAAALGAMGYFYMWWKDISFSDIMFVTKQNMKSAVANVSKQLDNLSESVTSTRKQLSKRLESLDWKIEEETATSKCIASNVKEMQSHLGKIEYDFDMINKMMVDLEGKLERLESSQDATNSGLWYLCQFAKGSNGGVCSNEIATKESKHSALPFEEKLPRGLQFLTDKTSDLVGKVVEADNKGCNVNDNRVRTSHTRVHRTYPVCFSQARHFLQSGS